MEVAPNVTKLSQGGFDFQFNYASTPFRTPHVNNDAAENTICLCGGYSPIKLGKQTLMDDNECEHYLQTEWPLILMIVFHPDASQTEATSIFVRANECANVLLSAIG